MIKKAVKETGMVVCSPHEFGRAYLYEKTGKNFVIPGKDVWEIDFTQGER